MGEIQRERAHCPQSRNGPEGGALRRDGSKDFVALERAATPSVSFVRALAKSGKIPAASANGSGVEHGDFEDVVPGERVWGGPEPRPGLPGD
jgi:hypothetical protein